MGLVIELPAEWEEDLRRAALRQGKPLRELVLDGVRQQLRPDILPRTESELLEIINAPLAPEARRQRDILLAEQAVRPLTEDERTALIEAIDALEIANAARWHAVVELAERRGISLNEIAGELQIPLQ